MAGGGQQAAASSLPSAQQLVKKKKIEVFFSPTETWYTGDVAKYHTRNDHNFHCHTVHYDDPLLPAEWREEILNLDGDGRGASKSQWRLATHHAPSQPPLAPPLQPAPRRRRRRFILKCDAAARVAAQSGDGSAVNRANEALASFKSTPARYHALWLSEKKHEARAKELAGVGGLATAEAIEKHDSMVAAAEAEEAALQGDAKAAATAVVARLRSESAELRGLAEEVQNRRGEWEAEVGAACPTPADELFSTTWSLTHDLNDPRPGKQQTYTPHYSRTRSSPPQVRNFLVKYTAVIFGGRCKKPLGVLPAGSDPATYPKSECPVCSHTVRDAKGAWSDVVVRHSGFIRCFLNRDEDQRFLDAFVRPWSKTLSDRCLQREKDIEVLMTSALGGATAAVGDAGGGGGGGGASVVAAALMDVEHGGGGEEESQHGS